MILTITEEMKEKIEHWWKKPISELTDVDAITIVEEFADSANVKDASFLTDDEIEYTFEEEDAGDIALDIALETARAKYLGLD